MSLSNSDTMDSNATGYAQIKRKRGDGEELENGRDCSRVLNDVEEEVGSRKKVRLSKCALLEESFQKKRVHEPVSLSSLYSLTSYSLCFDVISGAVTSSSCIEAKKKP